jgi:hypothetical protein
MTLMTLAEGPTLLSRLSNAQAVLRHTPRTAACLAVVSHPATINALRISASFEASLAFASNSKSANGPWIALLCVILLSELPRKDSHALQGASKSRAALLRQITNCFDVRSAVLLAASAP